MIEMSISEPRNSIILSYIGGRKTVGGEDSDSREHIMPNAEASIIPVLPQ